MKISAIQMNVVLGDRPANFRRAEKLISLAAAQGADVLVLPELWDLGFYPANALELGDPDGAESRAFLSSEAKRHKVNIVGGSVICRVGDAIRNTGYVFDRAGKLLSSYDKIHLYSPGGEDKHFQAGKTPALYEIDGIKVGQITCYDVRFGELTRALAMQGAKVLFCPATWPHPRLNHWRLLAQARAVENQFFVVAVNAAGVANHLILCGHSLIIDPWGEILAEAGSDEQILPATLDMAVLADVRARIPVFQDRKPETYGSAY